MESEIKLPELTLEELYMLIGNQQVHIARLTTALQQAIRDKEAPATED